MNTGKSLNRKVFRHKGSAIYIGDKIRDKYNNAFGLDGETVYLVSDIERREFRPINPEKFTVRYFGNIKMGRNTSICAIAEALFRINPKITIEVYSSESNPDYLKPFSLHKNIDFCGVIPYSQVMEKTVDSDILIVAEGTKAHDINLSRYALSTKVADALASGCNIVAYGSMECGAIEYLDKIGCATIASTIDDMELKLRALLDSEDMQLQNYNTSRQVFEDNHTRNQSNARVRRIVSRLVNNNRKE